jgi:hypothetical protein
MQHNVVQQEDAGFDVTQGEETAADQASRDQSARARRPRLTSQAERAMMHPPTGGGFHDQYDPDWRYYHGALVD